MCRLSGFYPTRRLFGWEQKLTATLATILLRENAAIGNRDGCGIADTFGKTVAKFEESALVVTKSPEFIEAINMISGQPFIGHVRMASTGQGAKEGAHPFQVGHILVAHNGTFTNYDTFRKQLNITGPIVDSHVFAHLLANRVNEKEVTADDIAATLKEVTGSYALLICDTLNGNLWVVKGSNSLYIAKCGPLWVINTSNISLQTVNELIGLLARLNYNKTWEMSHPEDVTDYSINKLTSGGLEAVAKIEIPTTPYRPYKTGQWNVKQTTTTKEARELGKNIAGLLAIPFVTWEEIDIAAGVLFSLHWYELSQEQVTVLDTAFSEIQKKYATPEKIKTWLDIQILVEGKGYDIFDDEVNFPAVINTQQELDNMLKVAQET